MDEMSFSYVELSEETKTLLFIDEQYQGNGYGLAAAKLVLDNMKHDGKYNKVILCYIEGNIAAKCLYEKLGFMETERDEALIPLS